ncbi:hypothetical protein GRZ55_11090 [Chelativorans sp. ZYF759]|uniref:hypothetical protein n=1 Tax=Chelativorans sp. ZYF759 TaxID=2692213 RepID=UPI00145E1705|nr:hypothetical protein [Chelativorans sp. ZYF759]NMG39788.1 hypothetical protein [Chelativorans sp. ZYF759]
MQLAHYRKLITMLVTGIIMLILSRVGLTPSDLAFYGLPLGDLQEAIVDFLMQVGIPAVFMVAQPNAEGDSLWRWWHWILCGLAIVALLTLIVAGVSWIF